MEHKIKKWKLLESEYIIRRPWLTARREKVQLPDGTIHPEYYVLEYPDWVNIIAETKDGRYVLVEQYRHGLGEISIELCAGCVEPGEAPVDGARRELLEETGFGGGEWELIATLSPNSSTSTNMCYCFVAHGVEIKDKEQHLDTTEDIAVHLVTRDELYRLLSDGEIKQAMMAAPLWKYFATKEK
ncbi:MAG: NUDIX hydrolase [Muribaculaceae bacterium]